MARNRCTAAQAQRRRAEGHAAAIREAAQDLRMEAATSMEFEEDMPMNRYVSPNAIPGCPGSCPLDGCCREEEIAAMLAQMVEISVCQNQILTDLLGAVNALTAAMLSAQSRC